MAECVFDTSVEEYWEFSGHQEFCVKAMKRDSSKGKPAGFLKGIIVNVDVFPSLSEHAFDLEWLNVFDSRAGHEEATMSTIVLEVDRVAELIGDSVIDHARHLIYLERVWVEPNCRGAGLALSLLSEAKRNLAKIGTITALTPGLTVM